MEESKTNCKVYVLTVTKTSVTVRAEDGVFSVKMKKPLPFVSGDTLTASFHKNSPRKKLWTLDNITEIRPTTEHKAVVRVLEEILRLEKMNKSFDLMTLLQHENFEDIVNSIDEELLKNVSFTDIKDQIEGIPTMSLPPRFFRRWDGIRFGRMIRILGLTTRYSTISVFDDLVSSAAALCNMLLTTPWLLYPVSPGVLSASYVDVLMTPENVCFHQVAHDIYTRCLNEGHTSVPLSVLLPRYGKESVKNLLDSDLVTMVDKHVYFVKFKEMEEQIAMGIAKLMTGKVFFPKTEVIPDDDVQEILRENVVFLTGPAGSGKTTLLRSVVGYLREIGVSFFATSFTGKATAKLRSSLDLEHECSTMDCALMRLNLKDIVSRSRVVIIDEISMVSNALMARWLKTFTHKYKLILVGDENQLEPIGPGSLIRELTKGGIYIKRLETVYRSREEITKNTQKIILGDSGVTQFNSHFSFVDSYEKFIPHAAEDRTIFIAYTNKTAQKINLECQSILTGRRTDGGFNVGDKVVVKKNLYNCEGTRYHQELMVVEGQSVVVDIYNGLEGRVVSVPSVQDKSKIRFNPEAFRSHRVVVEFHDHRGEIFYLSFSVLSRYEDRDFYEEEFESFPVDKLNISLIELSYALTIHKSQGHEWDNVCVVVDWVGDHMTRNLLYTAVTRAKKNVALAFGGNRENYARLVESPRRERVDRLSTEIIPAIEFYKGIDSSTDFS